MKFSPTYPALLLALLLACPAARALSLADTSGRPPRLFAVLAARQGSLLAHKEYLLRDYYVGLDLKLGWQTDDHARNPFDALFRYPAYGVGYYMGNMNGIVLGSDGVSAGLGKPAALYGFFSAPMLRRRRVLLSYGISAGLSYNFNAYSSDKNPFNILIGTKNNAYIELGFEATFLLPGRSALSAGVSFEHFSNGSFQKPNLGVNLFSGTLAYKFSRYRNEEKGYAPLTLPAWTGVWEWDVLLGGGVRMLDTDFDLLHPRDSRRWPSLTLSTALLRQTSPRRRWGAGLDLLYFRWGSYVGSYRAALAALAAEGAAPTPAEVRQAMSPHRAWAADNFTVGVYAAHELSYKRVSLITHLGLYPWGRMGDRPTEPLVYERVGVRVALTSRLFVGVAIRAHVVKADYTEWSVGYALMKK